MDERRVLGLLNILILQTWTNKSRRIRTPDLISLFTILYFHQHLFQFNGYAAWRVHHLRICMHSRVLLFQDFMLTEGIETEDKSVQTELFVTCLLLEITNLRFLQMNIRWHVCQTGSQYKVCRSDCAISVSFTVGLRWFRCSESRLSWLSLRLGQDKRRTAIQAFELTMQMRGWWQHFFVEQRM
jgi:hypothetical protein